MTGRPGFHLNDVLAPVGVEGFIARYWEREPLHIARNDPDFYGDFLDVRDLDRLLRYSRLRSHELRVESKERGKAFAALATVDRPPGERHLGPNLQSLREAYAAGESVVVRLRRISPSVDRLCRSVEQVFRRRGSAEFFLTPRRSQAFELHYDLHDVFLLQVYGTKTWQIYEPVDRSPSPLSVSVNERHCTNRVGAPIAVYEVRQGDLIYIPMGFPHQGITGDEASLHVTIGVAPTYVHDFMKALVDAAARDHPVLREQLRGAFGDRGAAGLDQATIDECLRVLASGELVRPALERLEEQFIEELEPLPAGQFLEVEHLGEIDEAGELEWHLNQVCAVRSDAGSATILFVGGRIVGPPWLEPQLRWIAATPRFRVREIPGDLSLNSRLVLVRRLVKEGFLRRAGTDGHDAG